LLKISQHHDDRGSNREQGMSARHAADALFTPKSQRVELSGQEAALTAETARRKPRVLAAAVAVPVRHEEPEAPTNGKPPSAPVIPAAHVARIRAWRKYGMTASQVAEVYGVAVSEVERVLRPA
jgi:hypothetical protein